MNLMDSASTLQEHYNPGNLTGKQLRTTYSVTATAHLPCTYPSLCSSWYAQYEKGLMNFSYTFMVAQKPNH